VSRCLGVCGCLEDEQIVRMVGSSEESLASVGLGMESRRWELRRFSNRNLKTDSVVAFAAPG
jgi:hypothetical protein